MEVKKVITSRFAGRCQTCRALFVPGESLITEQGRHTNNKGRYVTSWHHIECLGIGPDGRPTSGSASGSAGAASTGTSSEGWTREQLQGTSTVELRTLARRVAASRNETSTTWIASARKKDLMSYVLGEASAPTGDSDDTPTIPETPASSTPSPASDGDAITRLIADVARRAAVEAARETETKARVDEDAIRRMVAEAFDAAPVVKIQTPNGKVHDVKGEHPLYTRLLTHLGAGIRTWIGGPAGSGKTTAAEKAAAALDLQVFVQTPCATPYDVLGYKDANGNVVETEFSRWCRCQEPALLILDEVDGWLPPAQLAANAALANGWAVLPEGRVEINPADVSKPVVATANTWGLGANAEYNGRQKMDAAFRNRFDAKLWWGYDNAFELRLALAFASDDAKDATSALVKRIQRIRSRVEERGIRVVISPRQSIAAAKLLSVGQTEESILEEVILPELDKNQRSEVLG